ncbi:MAG TPA: hypothetical protein VGL15_05775 [Vicinamibacteria bacterium]|jgi:hypothetical protein
MRDDERPPTAAELSEIEERAGRAGRWRRLEGDPRATFVLRETGGREPAHLIAPAELGEELIRAAADAGRLAAALRKQRAETEDLRSRLERQESRDQPRGPRREAAGDLEEEAAVSLAAPFHVSPKAIHAAKTDPLQALAVQVARAMQPDAREVERARLLAMAFAASRGDLEGFWAARRQRGAARKTDKKGKS